MPAPTPVFLQQAFATNAPPQYRNAVPNTTVTPGRASLDLGFPALTMTPVISGGKPPLGQDVNGILYMVSSHTIYQQSGQPYRWAANVAAAIGGYAVGTVLGSSDGATLWYNVVNANNTDPDAGGAGWVALYSYGIGLVPGLNGGGGFPLTPVQSSKPVLVLSGALVANQQIWLPAQYRRWLIVNTCTGAFTLTVKTQAGTGVIVPQGGFNAPVEVWCDTVNIYNVVAPVNLPIDQAATPLTIVQRTNAGYILATYFNSSNPLEVQPITGVWFETSNDGYHRKISPANFAAQFALSSFGGQVTNAQVPQSAVTQHSAAVLSNAALTGTPTTPTAAVGVSNTQVASTAFANPQQSQTGNGYVRFPGGVFMQWGVVAVGNLPPGGFTDVTANFPQAFTSIFAVYSSLYDALSAGAGGLFTPVEFARSLNSSSFRVRELNPGTQDCFLYWFAIGV